MGDALYEAIATYSCNVGYRIVGDTLARQCLAIGIWKENDAFCESKPKCKFV